MIDRDWSYWCLKLLAYFDVPLTKKIVRSQRLCLGIEKLTKLVKVESWVPFSHKFESLVDQDKCLCLEIVS